MFRYQIDKAIRRPHMYLRDKVQYESRLVVGKEGESAGRKVKDASLSFGSRDARKPMKNLRRSPGSVPQDNKNKKIVSNEQMIPSDILRNLSPRRQMTMMKNLTRSPGSVPQNVRNVVKGAKPTSPTPTDEGNVQTTPTPIIGGGCAGDERKEAPDLQNVVERVKEPSEIVATGGNEGDVTRMMISNQILLERAERLERSNEQLLSRSKIVAGLPLPAEMEYEVLEGASVVDEPSGDVDYFGSVNSVSMTGVCESVTVKQLADTSLCAVATISTTFKGTDHSGRGAARTERETHTVHLHGAALTNFAAKHITRGSTLSIRGRISGTPTFISGYQPTRFGIHVHPDQGGVVSVLRTPTAAGPTSSLEKALRTPAARPTVHPKQSGVISRLTRRDTRPDTFKRLSCALLGAVTATNRSGTATGTPVKPVDMHSIEQKLLKLEKRWNAVLEAETGHRQRSDTVRRAADAAKAELEAALSKAASYVEGMNTTLTKAAEELEVTQEFEKAMIAVDAKRKNKTETIPNAELEGWSNKVIRVVEEALRGKQIEREKANRVRKPKNTMNGKQRLEVEILEEKVDELRKERKQVAEATKLEINKFSEYISAQTTRPPSSGSLLWLFATLQDSRVKLLAELRSVHQSGMRDLRIAQEKKNILQSIVKLNRRRKRVRHSKKSKKLKSKWPLIRIGFDL